MPFAFVNSAHKNRVDRGGIVAMTTLLYHIFWKSKVFFEIFSNFLTLELPQKPFCKRFSRHFLVVRRSYYGKKRQQHLQA